MSIFTIFRRAYEPQEAMREQLELTCKAARRCAHDLAHAADMVREEAWAAEFRTRASNWLTVFYPANGPKDYRAQLHRDIARLELRIGDLETLCRAHGIDCSEFPF